MPVDSEGLPFLRSAYRILDRFGLKAPEAFRYLCGAVGDYWRQSAGVRALAQAKESIDPIGRITDQLVHREIHFLDTVLRVVFERGDNPYFHMFRMAGCGYEDLVEIVLQQGLERTLKLLHDAGVYLTYDELLGSRPIVRNGREIAGCIKSFANPLAKGVIPRVSGSGRRGRRTHQSVEVNVYHEGYELLQRREFNLAGRAQIQLKSIPPSGAGLTACLRSARRGWPVDRWFAPDRTEGHEGRQWLGANFLVSVARVSGAAIPYPEFLSGNDFSPVSAWIARRKREGVASYVSTMTSYAVRVADAALRAGHDIAGTIFLAGGEVISHTKREVIYAAGAQIYPMYWIHELGPIGFACHDMKGGNCVHLFDDSVAVVTHRRAAPITGEQVDSLLFTTLLPLSPLVLINVETEDAGVVERATCQCTFRKNGYSWQLRDVHSFGKLTGMGVTLLGTDLVKLLEVSLPARFGGAAGDYQLIEREGLAQTEILLRISPRVRIPSCEVVKEFVLAEMPRLNSGWVASRVWRHSDAFRVIVAEPLSSPSGKILPLNLLGSEVAH